MSIFVIRTQNKTTGIYSDEQVHCVALFVTSAVKRPVPRVVFAWRARRCTGSLTYYVSIILLT